MKNFYSITDISSRRYIAIPIILALLGSTLAATVIPVATAATGTTLSVQVVQPQVQAAHAALIQVQIQQGTPSNSYWVTIQVALPLGEGGPFCETLPLLTDSQSNGQTAVFFPGIFAASGCAPAGMAGPATFLPGTYTVTASGVPAITMGTTFTVVAPLNAVSGSGSYGGPSATIVTFIPTGNSPPSCMPFTANSQTCSAPVVACGGTTTTTPTTTNAPNVAIQIGSDTFNGVISTNTPASGEAIAIRNPCGAIPPISYIASSTVQFDLNNASVNLPSGKSISGSIVINAELAVTSYTTGVTFVTSHWTLTGGEGLAGLTGTGEATSSVVTTGNTIVVTGVYGVQFTLGNYY